jgi:predicted negative regulator of RcsB-dependent stress response
MNLLITALIITGIAIAVLAVYRRHVRRTMEQARVRAAWLNKELEQPNPRIKVAEIWSEEQFEKSNSKAANAILEEVRRALSTDESLEATRLRDFLAKIQPDLANKENTPASVGRAWFSCLQLQDNEPESELAQLFKVLNDAWATTREGHAQIGDLRQLAIKTVSKSAPEKKVTQS